jgi:pyridoxamine 5'-phosphate oxidase
MKVPPLDNLENVSAAPTEPLSVFNQWFADAERAEPVDPNAMNLATVGADGRPSSRMVLLKGIDERGFVFYTNRESRKGLDLAAHPFAALCFYWKSLGRQVRIEGAVEAVEGKEADDYYASRGRGSRLGAWASQQSRPLDSRKTLIDKVTALNKKYAEDDIPRPPHWGGYRLVPSRIEFWHEGRDRLHTRIVYTRDGKGWKREMLYP